MRWLPAAYAICPHTLASRLSPSQEEAPNLQWREFALVYIAYMGFLVSRKNYGFWLRPVISELGYAKGQAGLIGSTLEVTYGTCSFLNGVVIDSRSPKHLLIGGLLLSALANLCVAGTESLPLMVVVWGLNGAVQSVGWPSVTNVFLAWFPDPAARGAWYSLLSTCQNAGAALVPLLVSAFVSLYGWRAALYAPAVASVCIALLLGLCLYGSPAAAANAEPSLKAKPSPADLAHTMRQQVRATLPLLCTREISHSQNPRPHLPPSPSLYGRSSSTQLYGSWPPPTSVARWCAPACKTGRRSTCTRPRACRSPPQRAASSCGSSADSPAPLLPASSQTESSEAGVVPSCASAVRSLRRRLYCCCTRPRQDSCR